MTSTVTPSRFLVTACHWADVETAWQLIVNHPFINVIKHTVPLLIGHACIVPFCVSDFTVLTSGGASPTPAGQLPSVHLPSSRRHRVFPLTDMASHTQYSDSSPRFAAIHADKTNMPATNVEYYINYFLSGDRQLAFPGTLHVAVLGYSPQLA